MFPKTFTPNQQHLLDDLVCEISNAQAIEASDDPSESDWQEAEQRACTINNQGPQAQMNYLLSQGYNPQTLAQHLKNHA